MAIDIQILLLLLLLLLIIDLEKIKNHYLGFNNIMQHANPFLIFCALYFLINKVPAGSDQTKTARCNLHERGKDKNHKTTSQTQAKDMHDNQVRRNNICAIS